MKFTIPTLAVLALTGSVTAKKHRQHGGKKHHPDAHASAVISGNVHPTTVFTITPTGPVTPTNPDASISSIVSYMSSISPTPTFTTKTHKHKHKGHKGHKHDKVNVAESTPTPASPAVNVAHFAVPNLTGIFTNIPIPTAACAAMPTFGYNYVPSVSNIQGFLSDPGLNASAYNASTPDGFVWNYAGFFGAIQAPGYMYYAEMNSYNPSQCAALCNATTGCNGFDIYFERDPLNLPGLGCMNPSVQTGIHCALYSTALNYAWATNVGQWSGGFSVVVTGANGYSRIGAGTALSSSSSSSSSSAGGGNIVSSLSSIVASVVSTPVATTISTAISTAVSVSVPTPSTPAAVSGTFNIISAYFGNQDITSLARTNFLVGGGLVINTAFPSSAGAGTGSNPFTPASSTVTLSILYTYNGEYRVFTATENTGTYTQQAGAWSAATCPGSTLLSNVPASTVTGFTGYQVLAATYGGQAISTATMGSGIFNTIIGAIVTPGVTTIANSLFPGSSGATNSLVVWYYPLGSALSSLMSTAANSGSSATTLLSAAHLTP